MSDIYVVTESYNDFYEGCTDDWANCSNESERKWFFHSKTNAEAFVEEQKKELLETVEGVKCTEEGTFEWENMYGFKCEMEYSLDILVFEDELSE